MKLNCVFVFMLFEVLGAISLFANSTNNNIPITENNGQVCNQYYQPRKDVLFIGNNESMSFHIRNNGISYQLSKVKTWRKPFSKFNKEPLNKNQLVPEVLDLYRVDINWLNSNENITVLKNEALEGFSNYYLPQCPEGALNVRSYSGVKLMNVYENVDIHYYSKDGKLKCDYLVGANTDYKKISFQINGARVRLKKNGNLILETPLGAIEEDAPIAFQNGVRIPCKYVVKGNKISFEVENYNPQLPLIIDPLTRSWGTYYGGASYDPAYSVKTDAVGNVYMAGYTASSGGTIIATSGSHQSSFAALEDAYLAKFNSSGVRQWGTYYGDWGNELGFYCSIDQLNNIYLVGTTASPSSTLLATVGAHQITSAGSQDAFLVKFNSNGIRIWGTYYGGTNDDFGWSCESDVFGNVFITGQTLSSGGNGIASSGSHQSTHGSPGSDDAFLVKFNSSGVRQWGTYYGGSGNDYSYGCSTDLSGNVFIAGWTFSSGANVVATNGSHQTVLSSSGAGSAFLIKFNASGVRSWGTYYCGTGGGFSNGCSTDPMGNIYLHGSTTSTNSNDIATPGAHQFTHGGSSGLYDAFLVKFNTNGTRLWGTYYGGDGNDYSFGGCTDKYGNIYITGLTQSTIAIASANSHQTNHGGGVNDAYIAKFNSSGTRQWASYYGGSAFDFGNSCCVSNNSELYLVGGTGSIDPNAISTPGAHQNIIGGSAPHDDGFLVKFNCNNLNPTASANSPICEGLNLNLSAAASSTNSLSYFWAGPNSYSSTTQNPVVTNVGTVHVGNYSLTVSDGNGCDQQTTINVSVTPAPLVSITAPTLICIGQTATLSAAGANSYTWSTGANLSTISVSPTITTIYSVNGLFTATGCSKLVNYTLNVSTCIGISENSPNEKYKIYPNPFKDKINIYTLNSSGIKVINTLGEIVLEGKLESGFNDVKLNYLSDGVYYVQLAEEDKLMYYKIIKQ
ncbi:MAG: T9SS type A sorting domain-containing protein [Bacteroidia bacterium]|nr:T9SS type A sorting domain-containing protein [Bacteroidia bacterium]